MNRALLLVALIGCDDALDQRLAIIDEPRVLAVIAEPAEARPGTTIEYRAVLAGPDGPLADAASWAFCTTPKPPTEDNVVSTACVAGDGLVALGDGATASGMLPMDGCLRFGPDVPPGGFRPRDADPTGGFYQPVRVDTGDLAPLAFGLSRITCNLANATPEAFRQYFTEYRANQNPSLAPLAITRAARGTDVTLTATWSADAAETYLYYDRARQVLIDRRESLRVSWFATGGSFPVDSTLIAEDDTGTSADITWTAPDAASATVWIVLRDSRGGIAVHSATVELE